MYQTCPKKWLYGRDRTGKYFLFISILKLRKTILKLLDKFRKDDGNDMAVDVTQHERSNIKCYTSTFRARLVYCNDYYMRIGISITKNKLSWNVISISIH